MKEKRVHPRYPIGAPFGTPIHIKTASETIKGAIGDISAGGIGIYTSAHLTQGAFLQIEFTLDTQTIICSGEIVFQQTRNTQFFYGCAFFDVPLEETLKLVDDRDQIRFIQVHVLHSQT